MLYVLDLVLKEKDLEDFVKNALKLFAFLAVKRHHGNLGNLINELALEDWQKDILSIQIRAFPQKEIQEIIHDLSGKDIDFEDFKTFIQNQLYEDILFDLTDWLYDLEDRSNNEIIELVLLFVLIYSSLLYADKEDIILTQSLTRQSIDIEGRIKEYRQKKGFENPQTEIDRQKNEAYYKTLENIDRVFNSEQYLYSISLPTGLGKTITSFAVAQKIRQKVGYNAGSIIINIPFTSIIDQNFQVFSEILDTQDSSVILKHHHLSEPRYKYGQESLDYDKSVFLIETWEASVIATTFVQLMETLLKVDKTKILKIPNLINSVVILDEVQTIDYKLWNLIRLVFQTFARIFNTYFVFVTATQPFIFEPGKEIIELVPGYKKYFKLFNRTKFINNGQIEEQDFLEFCLTYILENSNKDVLIILNTKNNTRKLFTYLRDNIDKAQIDIFYLTTLITPYERKQVISQIKQYNEKQKVIVSTQLVEAGVDISVDTIIRQLAPLDSLIQAAGRANRYNEHRVPSEVFVYEIKEWQRSSSYVYGSDLLDKTRIILSKFPDEIEEIDYLDLIENYYHIVHKDLASSSISNLQKDLLQLNFQEVNKWQLIEDVKHESLFVLLNCEAQQVWDRFIEIYNSQINLFDRKEAFAQIKAQFYDFVVNVPLPFGDDKIMIDAEQIAGFYLINPQVSEFYFYDEQDFSQNIGYVADLNILSY